MYQNNKLKAQSAHSTMENLGAGLRTKIAALVLGVSCLAGCNQKTEQQTKNSAALDPQDQQTIEINKYFEYSKQTTGLFISKESIENAIDKRYSSLANSIVSDVYADRQIFIEFYKQLSSTEKEAFIIRMTGAGLNGIGTEFYLSSWDTGLTALRILCAMNEDISETTRQMFQQGKLKNCEQYLSKVAEFKFDQHTDVTMDLDSNIAAIRAEGVLRLADQLELRDLPAVKQNAQKIWSNLEAAKAGKYADYTELSPDVAYRLRNVLYYNFGM